MLEGLADGYSAGFDSVILSYKKIFLGNLSSSLPVVLAVVGSKQSEERPSQCVLEAEG